MSTPGLEIWGGVECSIVTTRGGVRNQLLETGHFLRPDDVERINDLGIKRVRYPVPWSMVDNGTGRDDWIWTDRQLGFFRDKKIEVIGGFLHHGTGPRPYEVLDPQFPYRFAEFAKRVAIRYPWLAHFTPINEPFTTARMAGLYGIWYPFGNSEARCFQILVAQCHAIALAMTSIRTITPHARLIQTEDVGRIFSTDHLSYQAEYENSRRWLTFDLLLGNVTPAHPFYERMIASGADRHGIEYLAQYPCPPDVIGLDYYLTSDRYLDDDLSQFEASEHGGNEFEPYADTSAVRHPLHHDMGLSGRLNEVWERYKKPIALTEVHNGSTRDEQLRWLQEVWEVSRLSRSRGIDVVAVTAWALFGSYDWNSLMSEKNGYYEPGAFDVRSKVPRSTILKNAVSHYAKHSAQFPHHVLERPGWWRKDVDHTMRLSHPSLAIQGDSGWWVELLTCAKNRRLDVIGYRPQSAAVSGIGLLLSVSAHTGIEDKERYPEFRVDYPSGAPLIVKTYSHFDRQNVSNAVLDLLIDNLRGEFWLTKADGQNQYEINAVPTPHQGGNNETVSATAC